MNKLKRLYARRDQAAVESALNQLTSCARGEGGNLLDLSIKVMQIRFHTILLFIVFYFRLQESAVLLEKYQIHLKLLVMISFNSFMVHIITGSWTPCCCHQDSIWCLC